MYSYNDAKTENSFLYNKYLTNSEWRLYTVHKFTNGTNFKYTFDGIMFNGYYLIPQLNGVKQEEFTGYPNIPITYFAENAKVTLGGGLH